MKYNICGRECLFPSIPTAALANFQPSTDTFLIAWKSNEPIFNLTFINLLNTAYLIGGIIKPPFLALQENNRYAFLIEQPNTSILEHIRYWINACCSPLYFIECPYRLARERAKLELEEDWDDLEFYILHRGIIKDLAHEIRTN